AQPLSNPAGGRDRECPSGDSHTRQRAERTIPGVIEITRQPLGRCAPPDEPSGPPRDEAMMGLEDFMRPRFPLDGIPAADLAQAFSVLVAVPDVGEARVVRLEARHDDHLLVETGFQAETRAGSGKYILLRRTGAGWAVVEVSRWRS